MRNDAIIIMDEPYVMNAILIIIDSLEASTPNFCGHLYDCWIMDTYMSYQLCY